MQTLGIDISLVSTGIAVVSGDGVCRWRGTINVEGEGTGPRFGVLREALDEVFTHVDDPACVAIEEPPLMIFKGRDAASILKLYGAFAVAYAEAERHWPETRIVGVNPEVWKGSLDKQTTERMLQAKYHVDFANNHESDALGLADWAWTTTKQLLENPKKGS